MTDIPKSRNKVTSTPRRHACLTARLIGRALSVGVWLESRGAYMSDWLKKFKQNRHHSHPNFVFSISTCCQPCGILRISNIYRRKRMRRVIGLSAGGKFAPWWPGTVNRVEWILVTDTERNVIDASVLTAVRFSACHRNWERFMWFVNDMRLESI